MIRENKYVNDDGKPQVSKVQHLNGDYLPVSIQQAVDMLGGFNLIIKGGDHVLLKPNFNCSAPTPLSTDLGFLQAVIELLLDFGAKVTVGEMSGRAAWPTEKVIEQLGVLKMLKRYNVPFVNFFHDEWAEVEAGTKHWKKITVPRTILETEHRIDLPALRGHVSTRFSGAIKLAVGWITPDEREYMHSDVTRSEEIIAEINLVRQPDLILMDMRRSVIKRDGHGEYVFPNVIMASGDMVAIDTEGVRELQKYPENRVAVPVEQMILLRHAQEIGLGSMDYELLDSGSHLFNSYGMGKSNGGVMYPLEG